MNPKSFRVASQVVLLFTAVTTLQAATTSLATAPMVTSSSSSVKPNLLFILDDSGSMDSDYMPDWVSNDVNGSSISNYPFLRNNSAYNGIYYDPAIRYVPPSFFNADGAENTNLYPSMTGVSESTGGNSSASSAARNWKQVKNDAYGVQSTSTTDLTSRANYWMVISGEYCTADNLRTCNTQSATSTTYPVAALLRWCNSNALTTCKSTWRSSGTAALNYVYPRIASPASSAKVTFSSSDSAVVTGITVNGVQILSSSTDSSSTSSTVAARVAQRINACTYTATGNCGAAGYSALSSSGTVTIYANAAITHTPSVTKTGTTTVGVEAFASVPIYSGTTVPGSNQLTVIQSGKENYVYPGTTKKHDDRSDCAGTTCTFNEEMTNFANWWTYYRTRMQMMKTAASNSFSSIGSSFRVGFMTISDGQADSKLSNLAAFDAATKNSWYTTLFAANPNSWTPLRGALSRAGRLYAGKLNGLEINGTTVTDPMQYSCQQNFTILSTDGYWNTNEETSTYGPYVVDADTDVGNTDGAEPRPYSDGASYLQSTSQITQSQTQVSRSTSQLQKRITQIQQQVQQVQQRSVQQQIRTAQYQTRTQQIEKRTTQLQKQTQRFRKCSADGTPGWGTCVDITFNCIGGTSDASKPYCRAGTPSTWANASSCSEGSTSNPATFCRTTDTGFVIASSCLASGPTNGTTITCQTTDTGFVNSGTCNTSSGGGRTVTCQTASDSGWVNAGACTASDPANGPTVSCRTTDTGFVNATTCNPSSGSGQTVSCQTTDTGFVNATACTPSSGGGQTVSCQTTDTGWVASGSCAAGSAGGATTTCNTATTGPTLVVSCVPASATSLNSYTQTVCPVTTVMPATAVASCSPVTAEAGNNYTTTTCSTVSTGPTNVSSCTEEAAAAVNNYTTTTCATGSGGVSNTLADVAQYYYKTDLRTPVLSNCTGVVVPPATAGNDVCTNDVPSSGQDKASTQHMTTFTLGLGADGYMQYAPGYAAATSGDFYDVKTGSTTNTSAGVCSWQSSGVCNWPTPSNGSQANIDDLWHAAVNGRGTYFSAGNPTTLASGLNSALAGVSARLGASAAATTSNPNVTSGDNFVFSSTFTTKNWDGELVRQQISLTTGVVSPTIDWAAQALLDANTSRTIYTFDAADTTDKLRSFEWANLTTAEKEYFKTPYIGALSQFCSSGDNCLSATSQADAAGGKLVGFLRGDRSNEGDSATISKYFRERTHVLGDIVNAEAVYVKRSLFDYADRGYSSVPAGTTYTPFKTSNNTRQGMSYAAANDGMLHAFYAANDTSGIVGGNEAWAYIPSFVIPDLYMLADKDYSGKHRFFVDGTPIAADICTANCGVSATGDPTWKTILVGGLNGGGRGYYALDVTNPSAPKALWEFRDDNLGYTYGNPEVAKLADGTWVVMFASGYNNVSPGDGVGRLYILNADTGALIRSIPTGVGDTTTPSGLAKIRAWVNNAMSDNTALRVYGGDLLGNLWRFDIDNTIGSAGYDAHKLTTFFSDAGGTVAQPITTRPELGEVGSYAMIFVGTGRYLGTPDLTDKSKQTFYAVKDALDSASLANPRATGSNFVEQTLTAVPCPAAAVSAGRCSSGETVRTVSSNAVNFASNNGWYIDLPDAGERSNVDPSLALGTLSFNTNVPNASVCTAGGYSYSNFVDYRTGSAVSTAVGVVSRKLGNALATRGVFVRLPNNTVVQLTRLSDGTTVTSPVPIGAGAGTTRRVSWRELIVE